VSSPFRIALALWVSPTALAAAQEAMPPEHHHQEPADREDQEAEPVGPPLGLGHERWASGTAWQPDATPIYAYHLMAGDWMVMFHWNVLAGYDAQGSDRGDRMVMSTNWVMGMAMHDLGGGQLALRTMLSLEPLTTTLRGYPLLLQSGESYHGESLHDRQHPHDLFMEVAAIYQREVSSDLAFLLYLAPSGEPALGPPGFPHRLSAMVNPLAPIGHHWQDSTHISFGVVSAGLYTRRIKLDGSWFNGREPDEHRYGFDVRRPDSWCGRLTVNPTERWTLQASYGFLPAPEAEEPDHSLHRVTASVSFDDRLGNAGNAAVLLAWGRNVTPGHGHGDSVLGEGTIDLDGHHVLFGRAEYVEKTAHDLAVAPGSDDVRFAVGQLGLGYLYRLGPLLGVVPGLGATGAIGLLDADLRPAYGTRTPLGGMIFLALQPPPLGGHHH
jgi:hypothetical protein